MAPPRRGSITAPSQNFIEISGKMDMLARTSVGVGVYLSVGTDVYVVALAVTEPVFRRQPVFWHSFEL